MDYNGSGRGQSGKNAQKENSNVNDIKFMWLATTLIAALLATLFWFFLRNKYKLGFLSLMLWGATIMILVDYILGYEGGKFLETETDGMIGNSFLLGVAMLFPVFFIWLIAVLIPRRSRGCKIYKNMRNVFKIG